MDNYIPVIDLFAGPGGLAEGISTFIAPKEVRPFDLTLSVEKENSAWRTLRLRAFTRQFKHGLPPEYYQYIAGKLGNSHEDELFKKYQAQADQANKEALQFTLGNDCNLNLDALIKERLKISDSWVLIGGPPCQAYSVVGRARNKGNNEYRAEDDHRHFLYKEYLRIIKNFRPAVFVMENVK
jgi:DNA (cytosine-5)-methyltransferase 1